MLNRRKRLLNYHEEQTKEILGKVAAENNAHVFSKVRVADVLNIKSSGLSNAEFSYALRAHFDFVVANNEIFPLFAVEFDGPHHEYNKATIARDKKKNNICQKLEFPLLRVTSEFLTKRVRRFTLISWLAEIWFLEEAFYAAQEEGLIPFDEPFMHDSILTDSMGDLKNGNITFPYDLSFPSRVYIGRAYKEGLCQKHIPSVFLETGLPESRFISGLALIRLVNFRVIIGKANCRLFHFGSVTPFDLCQDLAIIDATEKLQGYFKGKNSAFTIQQANQKVNQFKESAELRGKRTLNTGAPWE